MVNSLTNTKGKMTFQTTTVSLSKIFKEAKNKDKFNETNKNKKETREFVYCKKPGHPTKDCRFWKAKMTY